MTALLCTWPVHSLPQRRPNQTVVSSAHGICSGRTTSQYHASTSSPTACLPACPERRQLGRRSMRCSIAVPPLDPAQQFRQQARRCRAARHIALPSISPLAIAVLAPAFSEVSEGLEAPVQLLYLLTLLGFLAAGAYLVVRQVLIRRELEEAAKVLGERIRTGDANAEDYFELGVILLRKKLYTQATKNLEKAKKAWTGEPEELAQVHNALGYAYFNMEKTDMAISEYQQAVEKQPGYVTAWNNLGDAFEKATKIKDAFNSYSEALSYAPDNKIASARVQALRTKLDRYST